MFIVQKQNNNFEQTIKACGTASKRLPAKTAGENVKFNGPS